MSMHLQVKVEALEKRLAALEYQFSGLTKKFPEGLHAKHKGFNKFYLCDRFDNPVHEDDMTKGDCELVFQRVKPNMAYWTDILEGKCLPNAALLALLEEKEAA